MAKFQREQDANSKQESAPEFATAAEACAHIREHKGYANVREGGRIVATAIYREPMRAPDDPKETT